MSDESQLFVRIPSELKRLVDMQAESNKELVTKALTEYLQGRKKSALELRREQKQRRVELRKQEIDELEEELADEQADLEDLDDRLDEWQSEDDAYAEAVDELLDRLEDGGLRRLTPVLCEDVGDNYAKNPEEVWEDARSRAINQKRSLFNTAFMTPQEERAFLSDSNAVPIGEADE